MDICRTSAGDLKLIEINSFSASAFYACNKREIVKAASTVALELATTRINPID
jgi:hypothetical protein